jgi:hypothetical protein
MSRKKEVVGEKPAAKPVVKTPRKKTTATTTAKKASSTSKAKSKTAPTNSVTTITPEERYKMIAQTAYYRAEARGFTGGNSHEDWLAAEQEVDQYLKQL